MNRCCTNNLRTSYLLQGGQDGYLKLACTLLLVAAMALLSPVAQAAKPGGQAVLLPPFIPNPAPFPFIQASSPFGIVGFIQTATVDIPTDVFSGGTVTVNGITITVPRNTLFQMPASTMTWQEMFSNAPAAYKALGQTGLALSDTPKPLTTYEINVQGNRVNFNGSDKYIAGLIFISNQSGNTGQGYINFIDYTKAEIWVSQTLTAGPTGARLRLNTAKGRYGTPDPNADVRFTADEDNPTITARTGYPMCLPRTDPKSGNDSLCPQWNRPVDPYTGAFSKNFTMQPATAGAPDTIGITHQVGYPTPAVQPDPFEQVPFQIGDYITFAGTLTADPNGGQYISAHTIADDIAAFTAPGTWPVYVNITDSRIGVGGTPNPFFPQEALEKIFGNAFTTDSTALVDVYGVDVDPCTGARTHRFYYTSNPFGPPLGGLKGRARFRTTIGNFLPPTREMAVSSRSLTGNVSLDSLGALKLTANGLTAGTFQAPQFEFIFPENLLIGSPTIPLTFQEFPFLVNGFGPYFAFNSNSTTPVGTLGQLSPWPGPNAPTPSCTIGLTLLQPPVANAGAPQTVASAASVTLDGGFSVDPNTPPLPIIYVWQQSGGPAVALIDSDLKKAHFSAPTVAAGALPVVLTFQLAACNGFTCGGVSSTTVTVTPPVAPPPTPGALTAATLTAAPTTNVHQGSAVALNATATGGTGTLTYKFTQTAGPAQTLPAASGAASASFVVNLTPLVATTLSFTVTVTDSAVPPTTITSAPVNVAVQGPDTITVSNVVYTLSKGKLQVAANTTALPKGAAVLTGTPIGAPVPISAVSNTNPVVLTVPGHGFASGTTPTVTISGGTGSWSAINGTLVVHVINSNTFSVPVDSTSFGPLTGTLSYVQSFGSDVVFIYNPVLDSYNILADIITPGPDSVRIRSSYGGTITAPVTKTR